MTRSTTAIFGKRVRDFMRATPLVVRAGTPVERVVAALAESRSTGALVVDAGGRLIAILTERDVARRVAFQAAGGTAVDAFATRPVLTTVADEYLYRAIARMRRHDLRHMPVVDGAGRPIGTVHLIEAVGVAAEQMMRQIDRLTREATIAGFAETKKAQADLARELLEDNLPAPEIQGLITDINRDIHRRILEAAMAAMKDEGWGDPPAPVTFLIMGSGGRGENFLFPDQDNGFIVGDYPDADHGRNDPYFIELAGRVTTQLDQVGFPLCRGNVMATNPLWRKTASQWRAQIALWVRRRSPVAVLFADIFFDFLAIQGPPEPAEALRQFVTEHLKAYPALLGAMCRDETARSVALGWFGRIVTDDTGRHPGRVDLKLRGTMPLVASARLYALRDGIAETGTLARIHAISARGIIGRDEAEGLAGAFNHITHLLLHQQLDDYHEGRPVTSAVDPNRLSKRERRALVESLRAIETFRTETRSDFTGAVF